MATNFYHASKALGTIKKVTWSAGSADDGMFGSPINKNDVPRDIESWIVTDRYVRLNSSIVEYSQYGF